MDTGFPRDGVTRYYVQPSKAKNQIAKADATLKMEGFARFLRGPSTQEYQIDVICDRSSVSKGTGFEKSRCPN